MLGKDKVEDLFKLYINSNKVIMKKKDVILYNFKQKEIDLRDYHEKLSLLNNQEKEINFEYFVKIKSIILRVLFDFNTEDIASNIENVLNAEAYIFNLKKELIEITKIIDVIKDNWSVFLEKKPKFKNSIFNTYYLETVQEILNEIEDIDSEKMSSATSNLNKFKDEVLRYIKNINKCNEYIDTYMFIGPEAEKTKEELKVLIMNQENGVDTNHYFFNKFNELNETMLLSLKESKTSKAKIEMVNVFNKHNKNMNKYTFKFGDYVLKYDTFFNNEELGIKTLNKYFYMNNMPLSGIFKGSDIILNMEVNKDYIKVNNIMRNMINNYLIIASIFVVILYLVGFLINIEYYSIFHLLSSISIFAILPFTFKMKKKAIEKKYNLNDFFLYQEINLIYFKAGANIDIKDLIMGSIREIDDTILNKKFIEWSNKNV